MSKLFKFKNIQEKKTSKKNPSLDPLPVQYLNDDSLVQLNTLVHI